jgi:DivIVA domain-containing protein
MTLTAADVRSTTFPAASRIRRGYDADEVDAFVERIAVRLESGAGLTSNEVYRLEPGKARVGGRGYAEADVDAFLSTVHLELVRLEDAWGHESAVAANGADGERATPADDAAPADVHGADEVDSKTADRADGDDGTDEAPVAQLPADGEALAEIAVEDPRDGADRPADPR